MATLKVHGLARKMYTYVVHNKHSEDANYTVLENQLKVNYPSFS
jgi:hypothetical protein